ncbi:mRNA 3'-end-processing protein rna14 [Marasmius crinis-equi]|uniref:mRNA 3'-end-processing protein RNA14 n=1 Tax=Marasmius crinis-equi TaxID=585013 RepID=A0ABR3FJA9_9AGAR
MNDGQVKTETSEENHQAEQSQSWSQSTEISTSNLPEFESLQQRLRDDPHDAESWKRLVACAEDSGETEKIRTVYESLLQQYPHTSQAQIAYINHFLHKQSTFNEAEELFKRYLKVSPSVDLCRFYLTYVRRINTDPATRDIIRKSYEFALSLVGQDKDAGDIWYDYWQLLKSGQTSSTWEEQQKNDAIRKVLHRAVQIPLDNVEKLWGELETFENNIGRVTAKKFMQDLSPGYMQAKAALRELIKHTAPLYPPATQTKPDTPPSEFFLPSIPSFTSSERQNVGRWKSYLKWEESNPLMLEDKDKATLIARIQSAYRKATIRMRYFPEIWFMSYKWTTSIGKNDEAVAQLKSGIEANPSSYVLNFALAEALEARKEFTEVHAVYEKFISVLRDELTALDNADKARAASQAASAAAEGDPMTVERSTEQTNGDSSANAPFLLSEEFKERRKEFGITYISYMRFVRRAQGVNASRPIFGKARKDPFTPWQVYESAALMEYHCSGEKDVAVRIFERGMSLFGNDKDYVLRYLGFLITVNDSNNARALFERVIGTFQPAEARDLWDRWARYENQYGDLETVQKLEKRMADVYPSESPIKRFASRYTYLNIDAIAARDLGFARAKKEISPTNTLANVNASSSSGVDSSVSHGGTSTGQSLKRQPGDDFSGGRARRRGGGEDRDRDHGYKRQRARSPSRERYDGPSRRRSPDRGRKAGGQGDGAERDREREREREEDKPVMLHTSLSWFISQLPDKSTFDGPVFRTDDLMSLLRNAVIPSSSNRPRASSPSAPSRSSGGRPPPDYGPYQGPNSARGGRRNWS